MTRNDQQVASINDYGIKIIKTNCTPEDAKDKSLPNNCYLLTLVKGEETWHDIVSGLSVDIFNAYYDILGNVLTKLEYTEGTRNPKLWKSEEEINRESKKKNERR